MTLWLTCGQRKGNIQLHLGGNWNKLTKQNGISAACDVIKPLIRVLQRSRSVTSHRHSPMTSRLRATHLQWRHAGRRICRRLTVEVWRHRRPLQQVRLRPRNELWSHLQRKKRHRRPRRWRHSFRGRQERRCWPGEAPEKRSKRWRHKKWNKNIY